VADIGVKRREPYGTLLNDRVIACHLEWMYMAVNRYKLIVSVAVLFLIVWGNGMAEKTQDLADLLPDGVGGWATGERDRTYDRGNLFDYINGGAELYISYGFSRVLSRRYVRSGQPDIAADVFDMTTSQNAFGVFSHSRETVDDTYGQGSQYTEGFLHFWKNRYYVSILASPETDESRGAVFELARHIETAIDHDGPLPAVLDLLPRDTLVEESVRYFRHHVWLNSHYFVADENILQIDGNTNAVLAKYGTGDDRQILLVVEYPDDEHAGRAYADFEKYYLPELAGKRAVQIEDGTWTGCLREGVVLVVVFDAKAERAAIDLIDAVRSRVVSR
jgi:hypothetical protein